MPNESAPSSIEPLAQHETFFLACFRTTLDRTNYYAIVNHTSPLQALMMSPISKYSTFNSLIMSSKLVGTKSIQGYCTCNINSN
jgi:hypothetical protein